MKHLKKFESEQPIQKKDLQETIDEVLDRLSDKGKLSQSEKKFMDEAAKGTIKEISEPKLTGNFLADVSNPHNVGILWLGKDNVWKTLEEFEDKEETSDQRYYIENAEKK